MAKQAKCDKCKIRFVWKSEHPIKKCRCLLCGEQLTQTNYLRKSWPTRDLGRIKPCGRDRRLHKAEDGTASAWDDRKDRQVVIPWKK